MRVKVMDIFYLTFCVPFYIPSSVLYHVSNCVWFVSILNFSYFIRKEKKIRDKLWLIEYKVSIKNRIDAIDRI